MREKWRDIKGYKGYYQVSNYGRVKSISRVVKIRTGFRATPEKILQPGKNEWGYLYVILFKGNIGKPFRVNRLTATAFKKNPLNKPEVNHLDGDRTNNYANNLEWTTKKENMFHIKRLRHIGKQLKLAI
jgi:NUMOD4 motif-containing protein/HNH endonuclease